MCQGRAVGLELNHPHQAPQPGTVGMGSGGCGILQPGAVRAAGGAGARVPVLAGAECAGQQPRPEPINAAQYRRYRLTPLFVPYSPSGSSCQHPGSKSTAGARLHSCAGCCTGPTALGPPQALQSAARTIRYRAPVPTVSAARGLRPPATGAAAAPMSYATVWSEKVCECLFIGEGWTRGSSARGVPIPQSCGVLLLWAPDAAQRTVPVPVPRAWHCHSSQSSVSPGPQQPWSCSGHGAGVDILGILELLVSCGPTPRGCGQATAAATPPAPTTPGKTSAWTMAPRGAAALCSAQPWSAPLPCVHRPTLGRGQELRSQKMRAAMGTPTALWVASWMESPKITPRDCFSEALCLPLAALRCRNES